MKRITILLLALAIALMAGNVADAKVKRTKRKATTTKLPANVNELMKFTGNYSRSSDGFVHLDNCPTSNPYIKTSTKVQGDDIIAKIFINGALLQTFRVYLNLALACQVCYLDANFDGYTDIFVGDADLYINSDLLLWDPTAKKFVKGANSYPIDIFTLDPTNKFFYFFYDNMISDLCYKCQWNNFELDCIEFVLFDCRDDTFPTDVFVVGKGNPENENERTVSFTTKDKRQLPQWYKDIYNYDISN